MNKILFLFLIGSFALNASEVADKNNSYSIYRSCEISFHNDLDNPVFVNLFLIASKKTLSINVDYGQNILLCTENHYAYGPSYSPRALIIPLVQDAKLLGISRGEGAHLIYKGTINISSLIGKSKGIYCFDEENGIDFCII